MTAYEQLKAARRAELKATEDARRKASDEHARRLDKAFALGLAKWLGEQQAEWLLDFHTDTETRDSERTAVFKVPGHATMKVDFTGNIDLYYAVHYTAGYYAVNGSRYMRLDDALIVAEAVGEPSDTPL